VIAGGAIEIVSGSFLKMRASPTIEIFPGFTVNLFT